jgi:Leucine-rich repeat (LRR) protein
LEQLFYFSAERNRLEGPIPTTFGDLSDLKTLSLAENRLTFLPSSLPLVGELVFLDLQGNAFQGTLLAEIGQLRQLRMLSLARNQFTGALPVELGELTNLIELHLANNQFNGPIHSQLGQLFNLRELTLNDNLFTGLIPDSFGDLRGLHTLLLQANNLQGTMPSQVCDVFETSMPDVYIDCDEVECDCCNFCCTDNEVCECRYLDTEQEWMCF